MYFPPAFFDISVHFTTHLIKETSNWERKTHTCEILKLENMDEYGCYVQLYFYDKLSSLSPSDMSDPSVKYV
jgi:hypothetical protein